MRLAGHWGGSKRTGSLGDVWKIEGFFSKRGRQLISYMDNLLTDTGTENVKGTKIYNDREGRLDTTYILSGSSEKTTKVK